MICFCLCKKSIQILCGVHTDLAIIVEKAITLSTVDFSVIEGVRTKARQQQLLEANATQTLNSRHLTGHAVDLVPLLNGKADWSWPLYDQIALAMKESAKSLALHIEWGGDWETFKDGAHFQLPWDKYPR
jgi:peptidoglycan LD-endopeptidase CwlK